MALRAARFLEQLCPTLHVLRILIARLRRI